MSETELTSVDLDKYNQLLDTFLEVELPIALCNQSGDSVWTNGRADIDAYPRMGVDEESGGSDERSCRPTVVRQPLINSLGDSVGSLVALIGHTLPRQTKVTKVARALAQIGQCMVEEYGLNCELDAMANELAQRYEELNLIYGIEEQASKYDPERGRDVIEHLVEECLEYVGVDGVVFKLMDGDFEVQRLAADTILERQILASMTDPMLELIALSPRTVVMNEPDDERWQGFAAAGDLKLLVAPVTDVNGTVTGVLALINGLHKPDFNNGHRRLVDVLAEQASAIVQANQDVLTGLLNRRGFEDRLTRLNSPADSSDPTAQQHALLHVNLDQFHLINDTYGHIAGDELLKELSRMVTAQIRSSDLAARLSGDEFAILLRGCPPERGAAVARKLMAAVTRHRFCWEGKVFDNSLSIGIASADSGNPAEMMSAADAACSVAKSRGRNRLQHFDPDDVGFSEHYGQMQWVPRIRSALDESRFILYAQPIVPVTREAAPGHFEILLRMVDEQGTLVAPAGFIPAAERYQMISEIDRMVVRRTLEALAQTENTDAAPWCCAVNLSGQSLVQGGFQQFVADEFDRLGLDAHRVCFEVTETAAITNFVAALSFIEALRERGCKFSLDDFGTGLSSFAYLKRLPVDYLKIDGGFVREMAHDRVSAEMVKSIHQIGHVMGIKTIAEFVDSAEILEALGRLGVDYVQGYYVGKPRPLNEVIAPIHEHTAQLAASGSNV